MSQGSLQDWEPVDSRAPGSIGQIQEKLSGLARPWVEAGGVPVVITENVLDMGYFFFLPSRCFYLIIRAGIKGTDEGEKVLGPLLFT